jgi:colicin import membrane protein
MIVFTATNKATNQVYVGSARDGMEEQWARLLVQAEEGGLGEFLSAIREFGAENFTVEMWSYAESPAESRELVRDACEELGAKLIKTGRAPAPTVDTANQQDKSEASSATKISSEDALINKVTSLRSAPTSKQEVKGTEPTNIDVNAKRQAEKSHGPVTSIDVNAYLASQKQTTEKPEKEEPEKKAEVISLRQKDSTKDFDDMKAVMMQIELKRRQNRATSSTKTKAKSPAKKSVRGTLSESGKKSAISSKAKSAPVKDKLPEGRVSSSAKERRIKEAIAQEKIEREAAQAAKAAAEADEMAAIMAKLDQRTKETERIRRRR